LLGAAFALPAALRLLRTFALGLEEHDLDDGAYLHYRSYSFLCGCVPFYKRRQTAAPNTACYVPAAFGCRHALPSALFWVLANASYFEIRFPGGKNKTQFAENYCIWNQNTKLEKLLYQCLWWNNSMVKITFKMDEIFPATFIKIIETYETDDSATALPAGKTNHQPVTAGTCIGFVNSLL
jgi:hypothetical protein